MSSRERWTVYPLLLLAIGMGIKTRVSGIENVPSLGCQALTINGEDGRPLVRIHANAAKQGQIEFYNPEGKLLLAAGAGHDGKAGQLVIVNDNGKPQVEIGSDGHAGLIQTCGPDGLPQMVLQSSKRGGNVVAWRNDHKMLMVLGHNDVDSGVFALDTATGGRAVVPFATLRPPTHNGAPNGAAPGNSAPGNTTEPEPKSPEQPVTPDQPSATEPNAAEPAPAKADTDGDPEPATP